MIGDFKLVLISVMTSIMIMAMVLVMVIPFSPVDKVLTSIVVLT